MFINLFQITILTIVFLSIVYIVHKFRHIYIVNYFLGYIIIHLCCDFYLKNGIFNIEGHPNAKEGVILYVANYIFYNILFFLSLSVFFFKKDKQKYYYFIIPTITYILIIFIFMIYTDFSLIIAIILFLSFFPSYIYSYYKKYW